jgi:hypothetical protein
VAELVETGPSAVALPVRQYAAPVEPLILYVHSKTAEAPGARLDTVAGTGPDTRVSVAPPAHGVRAEGATFTSAVVPLFETSIWTVMFCPVITLPGLTEREAVKSPIMTVLESRLIERPVPAPLVPRAIKYTLPEISALYFHMIVPLAPAANEKGVRS